MLHWQLLVLLLFLQECTSFENMNGKYILANTPHQTFNNWSTNFNDYPGGVEYFEVLAGPVTSTYSEVFWTPLPVVNLSEALIKRFNNKAMAVVGLEADQVRRTKDGDISVPISVAYNHHYGANLVGKGSEMQHVPTPKVGKDKIAYHPGPKVGYSYVPVEVTPSNHTPFPSSIVLGYSNGGEYRKTYKGLAPPFAQIIESPTHVSIVPMQIDTWNRDKMNLTNSPFVPGPAPKNSYAPVNGPDAIYSGLLECPLTTRIRKKFTGGGWNDSVVATLSPCSSKKKEENILTSELCFAAAAASVYNVVENITTRSGDSPSGCTLHVKEGSSSAVIVTFNQEKISSLTMTTTTTMPSCGVGADRTMGSRSTNHGKTSVTMSLSASDNSVNITLIGPSDVWYGIGFHAGSMSNSPYAMIVRGGDGRVTEHVLGNHAAGVQLKTTVRVLSNSVSSSNGVRTVIVTRSLKGATPQHRNFQLSDLIVPIISAYGTTKELSYHAGKESSNIQLLPSEIGGSAAKKKKVTMCLCTVPAAPFGQGLGTLEYLPTGETIGFPFRCNSNESVLHNMNPTCDVRTYVGGLSTCHHGWHLLDADQEVPWSSQPLEYWMKFRVYFQEYQPSLHVETFDITWSIAGATGEYDVPVCPPGTPVENCTHEITGIIVPPGDDLHFVAAHYHCHAPTCLSLEIWTWDVTKNKTIELLCKETPYHGKGNVSNDKFDEDGYIAVPICMWGMEPPFERPPLVSGVPLFVKATTNNTYGHHGEMALPQMLLAHM